MYSRSFSFDRFPMGMVMSPYVNTFSEQQKRSGWSAISAFLTPIFPNLTECAHPAQCVWELVAEMRDLGYRLG